MAASAQQQTNHTESLASEKSIDWVSIIKQWRASGLSRVTYCRSNNINYNQFVYQKAKLSGAAKPSSKLLPIKLSHPEQSVATQNTFILCYPSGLKLHIPINAHPEAIKTLISCLEKQTC
jgi:hypothetical protein